MRRVLKYLSVNQIIKDISDVNGVMSVKRFIITTIMAGGAVFGACMLYRVNYVLSALAMLMVVLIVPGLVRGYFKEDMMLQDFRMLIFIFIRFHIRL